MYLGPPLIRHSNLICFSSSNNISIANCYPWKHVMLLLDLPDLKVLPPTKTTGVGWKVWGLTTEGVLLFLWLELTIRTWLKCYLLTSAARHCGGNLAESNLLMASWFQPERPFKKCLMLKKRSIFWVLRMWTTAVIAPYVSNIYISTQMWRP